MRLEAGASDPAGAVSEEFRAALRCPVSGAPLEYRSAEAALVSVDGDHRYPIVEGVPILLVDDGELASSTDYSVQAAATQSSPSRLRRIALALIKGPPNLSLNVGSEENFERLGELLRQRSGDGDGPARVLVVGGSREGVGYARLAASPDIAALETDIAFGPRTELVCDAHRLPFADGTFDGVVCQAVLEHVLDPTQVVAEIHRVLAPAGIVYSEVPFMQQVHEGAYDFTRFTHLGHRRLFRRFDEISSGAQGGPGMALGWSLKYFLQSFCGRSRLGRAAVGRAVSLAFFWLKYFDRFLARTPGGLDAASGTFFLGQRREEPVGDAEIVRGYRGAIRFQPPASRSPASR
jgi:SAM-dependent methyltransferase